MDEYYEIRDNCRKGLVKHMGKVYSELPVIKNPFILDIGCGTGVPALWVAENLPGHITAIDPDKDSIEFFEKKINNNNLNHRIKTFCISFFDFVTKPDFFDIIIAEGFLNAVGFERGFLKITEILKKDGYLIIHDEFKDHEIKCDFIKANHCSVINTLYLDEKIWWNDYYRQFEAELNKIKDAGRREMFKSDIAEIEYYKINPSAFRSMYYLVTKCN